MSILTRNPPWVATLFFTAPGWQFWFKFIFCKYFLSRDTMFIFDGQTFASSKYYQFVYIRKTIVLPLVQYH